MTLKPPFNTLNSRAYPLYNSDPAQWLNNNLIKLDEYISESTSDLSVTTKNPLRLYRNLDNTFHLIGELNVINDISAGTNIPIITDFTELLSPITIDTAQFFCGAYYNTASGGLISPLLCHVGSNNNLNFNTPVTIAADQRIAINYLFTPTVT